jgi:hypothetical protein
MEVRLPDGTIVKNVPEGTTRAELTAKLARSGYDTSKLGGAPDAAVTQPAQVDSRGLVHRAGDAIGGGLEAGLSMLSGATTGLVGRLGGTLGGIAGSVASGRYGTQEGASMASQVAADATQRLTYEPKSKEGQEVLAAIGKLFDSSKLAGMGPSESIMATAATPSMASMRASVTGARGQVGRVLAKDVPDDVPATPRTATPGTRGSVGSAGVDIADIRTQRGEDLPIPIPLTKGQATRDFAQQRFERETAKNPDVGSPLRQRFAEQNEKILQNFDNWIDMTGAESGSLRVTGQVVNEAVVRKSHRAKAEINAAYERAKASGEMRELVDTTPLNQYIKDHAAEAINAPVLTSVEAKLKTIARNGAASINDLEELRKMTGRLGTKDATNAIFAKEVKSLIDDMTQESGGDLYRNARSLRTKYAREFEDHAVIDRLLSFKPGTKDRSVAFEDVFSHSIMRGSLDDVKTIRRTLQTSGPEGMQAWRELQGETLKHIRDEITKNVQIDQRGNRIISPARLDKLVRDLDSDGKLDYIFGKQGAQQIRDVNGIAQDVFTSPPGSVNHSNTATVLTEALDRIATKATGIPFLGSAVGYASKEVRNAADRKRVQESLNPRR